MAHNGTDTRASGRETAGPTTGDAQRASGQSPNDRINLVATLLMVAAASLLILAAVKALVGPPSVTPLSAAPPLPVEPVDIGGAIMAGSPNAHIALVEYSEFECRFCGSFARDTKTALWEEFVESGQLLVAFRHLPLESLHPRALRAAEAGECANRQHEFWAMHDVIFRDQANLDDSTFKRAARSIGLNGPMFDGCMETIGPERIRADGSAARVLEISATPTFLLGRIARDGRVRVTHRINGAKQLAEFQTVIRKLLSEARDQR